MNYKSTIVLLSSSLLSGDTLREVCPRCNGGSSAERSLSIKRKEDNTLVWQCHRSSCGEKGASGMGDYIPASKIEVPAKPRKVFDGTTKALGDYHLAKIRKLWGIDNPPYWYWTPDYGGRIAMSVRSPKYTHRGWVLRDIRGVARTKTFTFLEKDEEALSWYKNHGNDRPTVLVEDIPSAVRASKYVNAVALLGTAIGHGKALEISTYATRPIVCALDQDATKKSFEYAKQYALLWDTPKILVLRKDLKNMTEEELMETLSA